MPKKPFVTRAAEPRAAYRTGGTLQVSQDIMPIAELKAKLGDVVRGLDGRRPIVVTLNGKAAAVMMSPHEFDRLTYEKYVRDAVQEALDDVRAGHVYDGEEMFDEVLRELDQPVATKPKTVERKTRKRS